MSEGEIALVRELAGSGTLGALVIGSFVMLRAQISDLRRSLDQHQDDLRDQQRAHSSLRDRVSKLEGAA